MKDFLFSFSFSFACFTSAGMIAYGVSYPINSSLNRLSVLICKNKADRVLVQSRDTVFVNQVNVNCIERKYL